MPGGKRCLCSLLFIIVTCWAASPALAQSPKPKVRAITAFIRLEPARYQQQISDTLNMLREAKAEYQRDGYEVESVRITTQPFPHKWKKPLSARLQPVTGKKSGERTEFDDPFLTNAVVQALP